ncbi:MAG: DNA polymerase [Kiritimatiellaeota bacterium]|nr:DNA polymerase [Kiritimatiellota bacterium]
MTTHQPYDCASAERWEIWARMNLKPYLRKKCLAFLLLALRAGERVQSGFGQPVVANHRKLADWGLITKNSVKCLLHEADGIAIEVKTGQGVIGGAATQLRRLSIAEMESQSVNYQLREHTPDLAEAVAKRLRGRSIPWEGASVTPTLSIAKTGRIYTKRPNAQGDAHRLGKIAAGLPPDWFAIEVDYRRAEPTVLQHMLKSENMFTAQWPEDIYQSLASVCGITRDLAKGLLLRIMYAPNTRAAMLNLGTVLENPLWGKIANAVEQLKNRVWTKGKPRKGGRRFVTTLGGTRIEALKGEHLHRGKTLSWAIQGTVAEALNAAMNTLLDLEASKEWRVLYPVHDSIILAAPTDCGAEVAGIMQESAAKTGARMEAQPSSEGGTAEGDTGRRQHGL